MKQKDLRRGIIFDVDGTLWDSTQIVADAWNSVLEQRGMQPFLTGDQLKQEFGKTLDEIGEDLLPELPKEQQHAILYEWFAAEELALQERMPQVYDGLEETLRKLSEFWPLFIVSNAQAGYIELFLEKTGFKPYFTAWLSNGDTGLPKDGNIRLIMDRYHLADAVYVGDTRMDYEATQKAHARFAYASYGFGQVPACDFHLTAPGDLLGLNLFFYV